MLCLFIGSILAQRIRPKQLRKEVLQSQAPAKQLPKKTKRNGSFFGKPSSTMKPLSPIISPLDIKGASLVHIENSDLLSVNNELKPDVKVFTGNVRFRHDNVLLYCDSAYLYEKANSVDAFGHVKIVQGDTLSVFSDLLFYDGNAKLARLRHNVRMENRKTTLTTDSLNYDRLTNLAYYYTGGKIVDQINTLTSVWGQFSTSTNEALFKNNVKLLNKNFKLDADSLKYNSKTHIANLIGPSHILYNDETDIYSTRGWYNTTTGRSMLLDRSKVKHKGGKTIVGDTLFFDKVQKYGEGFSHVVMIDSVQKSTLYGNYSYYSDLTKVGLAADSALLVDWSTPDTLLVHADTLFTLKDSIYNVARGFYRVRFYRNDIQGICDSLSYTSRDSILNMCGDPVLWADNNQLSGEFIKAYSKNMKINKIHVLESALASQQQDSIYFNQLSGKEIIAYVDSGQLRKVDVNGNAETLYYPIDGKDSLLIGLNKTESSYVAMYLKNKRIDRIVLTAASTGTMYPIAQLSGSELYLKNFFWLDEQRPTNKDDLFRIFPKTPRLKPTDAGFEIRKKIDKLIVPPSNSSIESLNAAPQLPIEVEPIALPKKK